MSLSVNTPAFVNVDSAHRDHTLPPPAKINLPVSPRQPEPNVLNAPQGDINIDSGTLNKLFDMLDLVFKALRDMFAAKQLKADVKTDLPAEKPEAGKQALGPMAKTLLEAQTLNPRPESVTPHTTKADTAVAADAKAKAGDLSAFPRETLKQLPQLKTLLASKPDTPVTPDRNATDLPVTVKPKALLATQPEAAVEHDTKASELPVMTRSTLRPRLEQMLTPTPSQAVTVTNDAKANVHVSVNIDHCHCPETSLDGGKRPRFNVVATTPGAQTPAETTSLKKPEVTPHLQPGVILDPEVTTTTHEHKAVTHHLEPAVNRPPALTTTPPHEPENTLTTEGAVTSNRTPEKALDFEQKIVPGSVVEGGQDEVENSRDKVQSNQEKVEGSQDEVESGKEELEDGKAKVEGNKDEVKADSDEVEDDQKVDITSPGPAADATEFRGWNVSRRSNFGA